MSTTQTGADFTYQQYLNLTNNQGFISRVNTGYSNIGTVLGPQSNTLLANCVGGNSFPVISTSSSSNGNTVSSSTVNASVPTPPDMNIFFNFWNNTENINQFSQDIQLYIEGNTLLNSNIYSKYNDVNCLATYIIILLFKNRQYDTSGFQTSFSPDLLNNVNNQPAVLNIKNFLQSPIDPATTNLFGCGNFSFQNPTGSSSSDFEIPDGGGNNEGIVSSICSHYFQKYKEDSPKLSEEQLDNSYRIMISQNQDLLSYCGCFAPIPPIGKGTGGFGEIGNSPCDPLCFNPKSLSLFKQTISSTSSIQQSGELINNCTANKCLIDSSAINSFNSNGVINFNQVCQGCGYNPQGCICILDVSSKDIINKITYGSGGMTTQANYNQNCSQDSVCFKIVNGITIPVNCSKVNTPSTGSLFTNIRDGKTKITSPLYINEFFWFVVAVFFFLAVLFIYQISVYF